MTFVRTWPDDSEHVHPYQKSTVCINAFDIRVLQTDRQTRASKGIATAALAGNTYLNYIEGAPKYEFPSGAMHCRWVCIMRTISGRSEEAIRRCHWAGRDGARGRI